jgi:endonuclease/exonuclease/phosphatase (EEP) superfamily protein YafD
MNRSETASEGGILTCLVKSLRSIDIFRISLFLLLGLTACLHVPAVEVLQQGSERMTTSAVANCDKTGEFVPRGRGHGKNTALDPSSITLTSWNVHKGGFSLWGEEYLRIRTPSDLLLIQEAQLNCALQTTLDQEALKWVISTSYQRSDDQPIGVLTAASAQPLYQCALRTQEPFTRIPKSILITEYPLGGTQETLLVANVHAINFTFGTSSYREQLARLAAHLKPHPGPLLIAGDFNTWSKKRLALLMAFADGLGLYATHFPADERRSVRGIPLDYIFFRGLEAQYAVVKATTSSDHNLLEARFQLAVKLTQSESLSSN